MLFRSDEQGHSPPCWSEQGAVEEARRELATAQKAQKQLGDLIARFQKEAQARIDRLDKTTRSAQYFIEELVAEGARYLRTNAAARTSVPGAGDHGSRYASSRREFVRQVAAGQRPETGAWERHLAHNIIHNDGRWGTYVHGQECSHRYQGVDIPSLYFFEHMSSNRARSGIAQRYGLGRSGGYG